MFFVQKFTLLLFSFIVFTTPGYADNLAPNTKYIDAFTIVGEASFLDSAPPVNPDGTANAVIEIPAGTIAKWEITKQDGAMMKWEFKNGQPREVAFLAYPGNYGILPRTLLSKDQGGDGDPLDIIVLGDSIPRGSLVPVKIIGVLKLLDNEEQDDKIIAVPTTSILAAATTPEEMNKNFPGALEIIKIWFENYKGPGVITSHGFLGPDEAIKIIEQAQIAFTTESEK